MAGCPPIFQTDFFSPYWRAAGGYNLFYQIIVAGYQPKNEARDETE
jgi:hypothetical protein